MHQKSAKMSTKRRNRLNVWRNLTAEMMRRLPENIRNYIIAELEADARNQLANERVSFFKSVGKRRLSPTQQSFTTILSVVVGAVTFSIAPQLIANQSGRGPLAISAGLVGGGAASFFVHANATKALTDQKLKNSTQQTRKAILEQQN